MVFFQEPFAKFGDFRLIFADRLNFEICTTDFVLNEITKIDQAEQIQVFIKSKKLTVYSMTAAELEQVLNLKTHRNLRRIADKSVLWKALQLKCKLLTGDKNLRNEAIEQGLEVNGSIWVLRMLVETEIISVEKGIELLEKLKEVDGWQERLRDFIDELID